MNMKKTLYVTARAVKIPGEECDLSFVPPMTKRRFSPLQKVVFALLNPVAPKGTEPKIVFASRYGEVKLTHDLVETFNAEDEVSPWKFSSSVYNAAPGLYSVFAGNRSTYTAIAAGEETVENSLIEAVFENGRTVWCYAEEADGGYGAAMKFDGCPDAEAESWKVEVTEGGGGLIGFDEVVRFIGGEIGTLAGRRISLRRLG
ncbi:MAG: beta-ketoacyl synthase chain length factor [Kiritimatiellae bacterium]|nr:beta-ketoacyl synthase chain length factor [Kiritimatiellia bacterium]